MNASLDLLLRGGTVLTPAGTEAVHVGVSNGRISWIGKDLTGAPLARDVVDVAGLHVLPGVIDPQVHFREPGGEHKEDIETGTRAAVLGGVTTILEMPNTEPPTTTPQALDEKLGLAAGRAWCDHAFFVGARPDNLDTLTELELLPGCAGVKVFMGKSTGGLLVDTEEGLHRALTRGRRRVAVHAEDETRMRERSGIAESSGDVHDHPNWRDAESARLATERLLRVARRVARRVHVLHVTTADELPLLAANRDIATFETTPQHLTLSAPECYDRLGTLAQMNPPIRTSEHREALWEAVRTGMLDAIGSDHAPHTREEKARPYPQSPSGMTGVQTLVPVMLDHVHAGRLSLERFVDLTSTGPARVYGLVRKGRICPGYDADFTIVDLGQTKKVEESWIASRCGWSPFSGVSLTGWPRFTIVRGEIVVRDLEVVGPQAGRPVEFLETLTPKEESR